jgi:hypothetical protein
MSNIILDNYEIHLDIDYNGGWYDLRVTHDGTFYFIELFTSLNWIVLGEKSYRSLSEVMYFLRVYNNIRRKPTDTTPIKYIPKLKFEF